MGSVWRGFYRCLRTAEYFLVVLGPCWDAAIQMTTESQVYSNFEKRGGLLGDAGGLHVFNQTQRSAARFEFGEMRVWNPATSSFTLCCSEKQLSLLAHSLSLTLTHARTRVPALMWSHRGRFESCYPRSFSLRSRWLWTPSPGELQLMRWNAAAARGRAAFSWETVWKVFCTIFFFLSPTRCTL